MVEQNAQDRPRRPVSPARWVIVILLGVIAACLVMEVGLTLSAARADEAGSGREGAVFAVAGKVTPETYGVYLVDTKNSTICLYQYLPSTRRLRLMAARTFAFDRMLENYNTEPDPREIKKLVEGSRPLSGATTRP
jgi:hypothetical protein